MVMYEYIKVIVFLLVTKDIELVVISPISVMAVTLME